MIVECLAGQAKFAEAEPLLLDGYAEVKENAKAIPETYRTIRLGEPLDRRGAIYEAWQEAEPDQGHDAKAAEWRAKLPVADPGGKAKIPEEKGP